MYNDKEMIKLFGFPFCFVHGTHVENLTNILKKEELSFSSEVKNNKNVKIDWGGGHYIHCFAIFKENPMSTVSLFWVNLIINPKIMFEHEIIFNSHWLGEPYQTKEQSEENLENLIECLNDSNTTKCIDNKVHLRQFSIYLLPEDTIEIRKFKLKLIKYYVTEMVQESSRKFPNTHEFLFAKHINLKKYMTHVVILNSAMHSVHKKRIKITETLSKLIVKLKNKTDYSIIYTKAKLGNTMNKYIFEWSNKDTVKLGYYDQEELKRDEELSNK